MDGDGFFKCAVTTLSPLLKNQWPLHPSVGLVSIFVDCGLTMSSKNGSLLSEKLPDLKGFRIAIYLNPSTVSPVKPLMM
jgi:hypothetical protein